jgi:hypothetical protein
VNFREWKDNFGINKKCLDLLECIIRGDVNKWRGKDMK